MKLRHLAIGYVVIDSSLILKTTSNTLKSPPGPLTVYFPLLILGLVLSTTTNVFLLKGKRWARKFALTVNLIAFPFAVFAYARGDYSALVFMLRLMELLLILAIHLISRSQSKRKRIEKNDSRKGDHGLAATIKPGNTQS